MRNGHGAHQFLLYQTKNDYNQRAYIDSLMFWMSVKLGKQSRCASALQEQPNQQRTTLAIAVQYWVFVWCMCLQNKPEISWSLLTRHTLFSYSYLYLVAGMKNIISI